MEGRAALVSFLSDGDSIMSIVTQLVVVMLTISTAALGQAADAVAIGTERIKATRSPVCLPESYAPSGPSAKGIGKELVVVAILVDLSNRGAEATTVEKAYRTGELSAEQRTTLHAENAGGLLGGWGGAVAGAKIVGALGAAGGSAAGPIGTSAGATGGAIAGGIAGYYGGEAAGKAAADAVVHVVYTGGESVKDAARWAKNKASGAWRGVAGAASRAWNWVRD